MAKSVQMNDLDALEGAIQKARNVGALADVLRPEELLVLIAEVRAARKVVAASRKRREEQSHWFGPDFFMADKPLVEQAFLNACRAEDAVLAELDARVQP